MQEERSKSLKWGGIAIFVAGLIIFILKLIECIYQLNGKYLPEAALYLGLFLIILGFYMAFIASYKK